MASSRCLAFGCLLVTLALAPRAFGDATVKTLGGGRLTPTGSDYGSADGDSLQLSQFHTPFGLAVDATSRVYVADRDNGMLRRIDVTANRTRTLLTGLNIPVAVALDNFNIPYVLTQGDGAIQKYDRGLTTLLVQGLVSPAALAFDGEAYFYVAQGNGTVVRVSATDGTVSAPVISGLVQPGGIAVLDSGYVAVSETGGNRIRIWDPATGKVKSEIGTGTAGFTDGPPSRARFNSPQQLAKTQAGGLIVADRANQRVRMIDPDGFVSTLYGIDASLWEGPACTSCDPIILPGWYDGTAEFAEAREPVGVAVSSAGEVFTTEVYYHLIREVTGVPTSGGGEGGTTNVVVLPPVIQPASGYFPMGQTITVSNPNASSFLPTAIYYTTDGTDPTTNSFRLALTNGVGSILWQEKQRDLRALKLKAFLGSNASTVTSGKAVSASEIGVPQDIAGSAGSTAIVPIVLNLSTNDKIQSLQFRVEITPDSPAAPVIPDTLEALSISTNDFISLYRGGGDTKGPALFQFASYGIDRTRGLAVTYIGTNANLVIKDFGVGALLSIPIPPEAHEGDRFTISMLNASGTSDGAEARVALTPMASRKIVITNSRYLVGDSSPAIWYNAGQFDANGQLRRGLGDGLLENNDVNNVFAAAMGSRIPFPHTDLFDAMDAYPEDTISTAGGDGDIRFLDWQVVLMRSLGLESSQWERNWTDGGQRQVTGPASGGLASLPGTRLSSPLPGTVWSKDVTLAAHSVEQMVPGIPSDVPVSITVAPGKQIAGLAFRILVDPDGAAPPLDIPVRFIPSADMPAPPQNSAPSAGTALCGWPLVPSSSFEPPLRGSNLLGYVRVTLPAAAHSGQSYTLHFANADGSPDLQTQYDFETQPGLLWVLTPALRPSTLTSDEWKQHFFGSVTSDAASDNADPDHDGVPNWVEYRAGTDPTKSDSYLHLQGSAREGTPRSVVLRWLSAPGKIYQIESCSSLLQADWVPVARNLAGDGTVQEWSQPDTTVQNQFYRIGVQP